MVVINSDYSCTRVYENKEKAIESAKKSAADGSRQTALYRCHLGAVFIPKEPEMMTVL